MMRVRLKKCPKCSGEILKHCVETNLGSITVYACVSCGYSFLDEKKPAKPNKTKKKIDRRITDYA